MWSRSFMTRLSFLVSLSALAACSQRLEDARFATGSATMVSSSSFRSLYAVNVDEGTVSQIGVDDQVVGEVAVGSLPTRIARAGDRILVTLRGERSIAVLEEGSDGLKFVGKVEVGPEPYGIVASEKGDRVFVSLATANEVVELDGETLTVLRRWSVGDEPRWLALNPNDKALYVGSAFNGRLSYIDLGQKDSVEQVRIPEVDTFLRSTEGGDDFEFDTGSSGAVAMSQRLTGDIAVSPDGNTLVVPVLYTDNINRVTPDGEEGDIDVPTGESGGYASQTRGIGRFNPALVMYDLGSGGRPLESGAQPVAVSANADPSGFNNDAQTLRSYISSASVAPNSMIALATMEGSGVVMAVPTSLESGEQFEPGQFTARVVVPVVTDAGPKGIAFIEKDSAFIHSYLDRTVGNLHYDEVEDAVKESVIFGSTNMGDEDIAFDEDMGGQPFFGVQVWAKGGEPVAQSALSWEIEQGRRLFMSATDSRMVANSGGVSCGTCHLEGRNDGLTWPLEAGPRNTPSLSGPVSHTAPVTWTDNVPSVGREAQLTSANRMGGEGLTDIEAALIQSYVSALPRPDSTLKGEIADPAVIRGKVIFERSDTQCSTCHTGQFATDNKAHAMFGEKGVFTPTLVGVAVTAPYFHDGSAATLRDVIVASKTGEMGDTSMLDDSEMADLEAYLSSL